MNPEALIILEQSVRWALLAFLGSFLILALYSWTRLRRRRRGLADLMHEQLDAELSEALGLDEAQDTALQLTPSNRLRPFFYSFLLAGVVSVATFLLCSFAPLPFLHNFATEASWRETPLRLTAVDYERFFEGFSLEGQVWNQQDQALASITAHIEVLDAQRQVLDEVSAQVKPTPLAPAQSGKFEVRYTENSPLIYGYRIAFRDAEGNQIPHVEGFEIR